MQLGLIIAFNCFISCSYTLTLNPLTWKIWWAPNNARKWQVGFNLEFKGLREGCSRVVALRLFHRPSFCSVHELPALFSKYNQEDATFHNLFISVRRSTCFRRFFRPSSGAQNCTYRPILLPAASLARLAAGSSNSLTNIWRCMCNFELLMMDLKTVRNMYSVLQK